MPASSKKKKIVVSIPAYNEEKTLGQIIQSIKNVMRGYNYEVQVIDDGSVDRTVEIARKSGAKVISHPKNYGLAQAFNTELDAAIENGADIVVHIDADGQYLAEEIPKLLHEIDKGSDLVLGSRFLGKIESMPLINRLGNMAFSSVISQIIGQRITDAQTGFRAFTREVAKRVKITSTYTYTHEQLIRSEREKFKIAEVPVTARKTRKSRLMRSPFDYAIKAWINILRLYRDYEPLKFFGMIGGSLFAAGFVIGIFIIATLMETGTVGGIPRVILSALLILTGIQIITLGFLADMNRK
ncbi:MAG: glycosyltransferase family 2 protein [Nanoarchaeota archaeon]|nr:MAG: glycosyltransferase family 2 protein [Nanoarchaeota archaeon]